MFLLRFRLKRSENRFVTIPFPIRFMMFSIVELAANKTPQAFSVRHKWILLKHYIVWKIVLFLCTLFDVAKCWYLSDGKMTWSDRSFLLVYRRYVVLPTCPLMTEITLAEGHLGLPPSWKLQFAILIETWMKFYINIYRCISRDRIFPCRS